MPRLGAPVHTMAYSQVVVDMTRREDRRCRLAVECATRRGRRSMLWAARKLIGRPAQAAGE
jgi:hypothetical protein